MLHISSASYLPCLSLAGAATSIILSRENACRDKHIFVATNVLSRQVYFCRDKHVFVATKHVFCRDKSMLVARKPSSPQICVCHGKHTFVATKIILVAVFAIARSLITGRRRVIVTRSDHR